MAETIVMPRQGNSVESCVLLKWRVKEGDAVEPKTIVAEEFHKLWLKRR